MWHKDDYFRDGTVDLQASEAGPTSTTVSSGNKVLDLGLGGTGPNPSALNVEVSVPAAGGTNPTADLKLQTSDTVAFSTIRETIQIPQITAKGRYMFPPIVTNYRYIRLVSTVGGTSPNFGKVRVGLTTGSQRNEKSPF